MSFERALEIVLGFEGAEAGSLKGDPGGLTKWGISQRAYPGVDIATLTREDAAAIYRRDYWDRVRGDELPWPLALVVFDCAVNCGVAWAAKALQRAVGAAPDGALGIDTLARTVARTHGQRAMILDILSERGVLYDLNPQDWRGWYRRLCELAWIAAEESA